MVQILGITGWNVIAAKATTSVSERDYFKLLPLLISYLKQHPTIRLYVEVADFASHNLETFCDHLKFDGIHAAATERVALVGDIPYQPLLPKFLQIFHSADIRFFSPDQKEEAIAWINAKDNPNGISIEVYLQR